MTIVEIAKIYTDLVNLDNQIPSTEGLAKEEVGILRSQYHQMLMDKFQEEGIEYVDRFDAMRQAFEIVEAQSKKESTSTHLRKNGT